MFDKITVWTTEMGLQSIRDLKSQAQFGGAVFKTLCF